MYSFCQFYFLFFISDWRTSIIYQIYGWETVLNGHCTNNQLTPTERSSVSGQRLVPVRTRDRQCQLSTRADEAEYCTRQSRVLSPAYPSTRLEVGHHSFCHTPAVVFSYSAARPLRVDLTHVQNITESRPKTRRFLAFDSVTFCPRLSNILLPTQW